MFDWSEKAVDVLIKVLVGVFTGGGVLSASFGSWFGRFTFGGFTDIHGVRVQNENLLDFDVWNVRLIFDALSVKPGLGWLVALLGLLGLIALVVSKISRPRRPSPVDRSKSWRKQLRSIFECSYCPLVILVFLILVCCLWCSTSIGSIAVFFFLTVIPGVLYLVLFSKDLASGRFGDSFTFIVVGLLCVVAIVGLPLQYGKHVFDPVVWQVRQGEDGRALSSGEVAFIFEGLEKIRCTLSFLPDGNTTLSLSEMKAPPSLSTDHASLREWITRMEPPEGGVALEFSDFEQLIVDGRTQ